MSGYRIGIDARLWNETGVGRYIRNLVTNLQKIDDINEFILFVRAADYQTINFQISSVRQTQDKDLKWKIVIADIRWHTVEEQVKLPKILQHERLDLMHFPYFSIPIFYSGKYIITIHDLILHHFSTGKASTLPWFIYQTKYLAYKWQMQISTKRAKKIIAVSQATKQEIISHLHVPDENITVTYEGIDKEVAGLNYNVLNKENPLYEIQNTKYFLYVGNAYPHKNLERLIEAFSLFTKQQEKDIKLLLIGKDDYFYRRLKEDIKKQSLQERIHIINNVTDEQLSSFYKNAIALIIPSLMEGFGLPALEAMSNNCLVLASYIPSLLEICQDNAIYFDPLRSSDIAEKLAMVYKKTSRFAKQRKNGLERANIFSWEKMTEQTLKIYESCARI